MPALAYPITGNGAEGAGEATARNTSNRRSPVETVTSGRARPKLILVLEFAGMLVLMAGGLRDGDNTTVPLGMSSNVSVASGPALRHNSALIVMLVPAVGTVVIAVVLK